MIKQTCADRMPVPCSQEAEPCACGPRQRSCGASRRRAGGGATQQLPLVLVILAAIAAQQQAQGLTLNGYKLTSLEQEHLDWLKKWTLPNLHDLKGNYIKDKATRCHVLAVSAWWSLKEGNLRSTNLGQHMAKGHANLWGISICQHKSGSMVAIRPTDVCRTRLASDSRAWQLGITSLPWSAADEDTCEDLAITIYRNLFANSRLTIITVLHTTLVQAGFSVGSTEYDTVMATLGKDDPDSVALRRSWVMRNHLVGAALNMQHVGMCENISSCSGFMSWCCGDWAPADVIAHSPTAIRKSIHDLREWFCA